MNYQNELAVFIASMPDCETSHSLALVLAKNLRRANISCESDTRDVKIKNKIKLALHRKAFFFIAIGPEEINSEIVVVKDLDRKTEQEVFINSISKYILHHMNCIHCIG